jgi:hypothetical protein
VYKPHQNFSDVNCIIGFDTQYNTGWDSGPRKTGEDNLDVTRSYQSSAFKLECHTCSDSIHSVIKDLVPEDVTLQQKHADPDNFMIISFFFFPLEFS